MELASSKIATCSHSSFLSPINRFLRNENSKKKFNVKNKMKSLVIRNASDGETAVVIEKPKVVREYKVFQGSPMPFGATAKDGGVNFAVHSSAAVSATLCLISLTDLQENRVTKKINLDPLVNKTGDVWHAFLKGDFENMLYGYTLDGNFAPEEGFYYDSSRILLDPYAKAVISREEFGSLGPGGNCWPQMAGMVPSSDNEFDWEGDLPLMYSQRDLIIYEMHVRGFTRHGSSGSNFPGTYLGVVEKLDHLKVLMDVVFNHTAEGNEKGPILSFRGTVLHATDATHFIIENCDKRNVYVCVNDKDKCLCKQVPGSQKSRHAVHMDVCCTDMKGAFHIVQGEYYNYSGCGNTLNCNHPVVRQFILDCLRYWVEEMHVDGFRFDLASILTRSSSLWDAVNVYGNPIESDFLTTGTPLSSPPLIDMISNDPILRRVKLIAEAWDAGGLYQVGTFPHWGIWSEWNGKYRDIVRQFIKGTDGFSGAFAECLCGSPNLYQGGRKPWNSINFICAHDGFTLADLVTYNKKHNLANGEENSDGENHNNSWNCGQEGEFANLSVKRLRKRQMRNFFLCLMVSQGVPMIYMGDEYGHTKGGNNNTYCHDSFINYFRWDKKEDSSTEFFRFCCLMTKFRRECESLGLDDFPTADRLQWHGHHPGTPDWSETSRFVAFSLMDSIKREIYIAFNTSHLPVTASLPERPGYRWEPLVDTSKPTPFDFLTNDLPEKSIAIRQYSHFLDANLYPMLSYSSIILLLAPDDNA
ncbi:hypothetical protein IFM89_037356 [Coptis chinensis]|uniref:Glycosyl hydrolase family 13 catalytic domain-containing protein n=1 Tax=Coptis chinensis TaxID=261450 RepID=A0A835M8D4_9MAGN|nr:hypothetical protein IFM89_037356 [Coptis chinensis]